MNQPAALLHPHSLQSSMLEWVERLGLFLLLAMPLLMFLGIATCDIALVSIAVLFVLRSCLLKDFSWLKIRWLQLGLVLWLYIIAISPYALVEAKLSFRQALPFGRFVLFAAALQCWLLDEPRNRRYFIYALGGTLVFIAINTIFSFVTGLTLFGHNGLQYEPPHHSVMWIWARPFERIRGLNGKLNVGIMLAWTVMPFLVFLFGCIKRSTELKNAAGSILAVMLVCLAILLTGERMALLELCLGMLLVFCFIKRLRKVVFIMGAVFALCGLLLLSTKSGLWARNISSVYSSVGHLSSHNNSYGAILRAALAIFRDHPIFGAGLKQYFYLSQMPPYDAYNGLNTHVQNVYLEWLSGTGLIGTTLFLGLLFCWLKQFWQQRAKLIASALAFGVLIAFFIRIWPLASTTSFFFAWGGITFWWMGAWLLALTKPEEPQYG